MTVIDVLIVEDDKDIATLLKDFLEAKGYIVNVAHDGNKALELYERYGAKLVILDIMLPGLDGFGILTKIRENSNTPVIIASAKDTKEDKLNGIIAGADDYIDKPYDIDILLAKIDGIFKRRYATDVLLEGDIKIDKIGQAVYYKEQKLDVTIKEYELLLLLISNKGKVLSKDYIFNEVWGYDSESEIQTVTVHIKWLRSKIEKDPKNPKHILTVWGVGYKFEA